jgi:hypothetical protein
MKRMILIAAVAVFAAASRASAEPGRFDALKSLIDALPAQNPAADPDYLSTFGDNIPAQLTSCHWKPEEMDAIDRIIDVIQKHRNGLDYDKKAIIEDLGKLPDFADRDKDPKAKKDFGELKFGIGIAPDMTKASLINADCRALLRQHFDNGATRDVLMGVLVHDKFGLDAALPPR